MSTTSGIVIPKRARVLVIVGPTSSGKTTLAKKLQTQFLPKKAVVISHDDIVNQISHSNFVNQEQQNMQFRIKLIMDIKNAVSSPENDLIIVDTLNVSSTALSAFLILLNFFIPGFSTKSILLKVQLPEKKNIEFARKHYPSEPEAVQLTNQQICEYRSAQGSLFVKFSGLVQAEYPVNPLSDTFIFE